MEVIEVVIIIAILLAQGYVAYLAWRQINSISHFLRSEEHLQLRTVEGNRSLDFDNENVSYNKLSSDEFVARVKKNSALQMIEIELETTIHVGDKVVALRGVTRKNSIVIDIIDENGNYVSVANRGQKVFVKLDMDVDADSYLYRMHEAVINTSTKTVPTCMEAYVSVIYLHKNEVSPLLREIVKTINNYLKKNKGGAADFHLIKDIVERHTDAIDEEINHKLPVPIYLGLMGTVIGIIVGLFSLNFQYDPSTNSLNGELFVNSVSGLISGVKLAMICSVVGLGLTTLLSSWRYMGAKSKLEKQKNAFYDFIQTCLLPQMTKDAASTILSLQSNLEKFNKSFNENIKGFGDIMDEIHDAFDSQVQLQRELKRMDLAQVANLNVNVLSQLRRSMTEFEKFTQYLGQMNTFVRSTASLTDSINDQLQRTEAVETVVDAMKDNIQKNQLVMEKLRMFLERVNEQQAVITAAGDIDSAMSQAINDLKLHAEEQIRSIRTYTSEATEDLRDLVTSERGHLRSLDKLGQLDNLGKLISSIQSLDNNAKQRNKTLEDSMKELALSVRNVRGGNSGNSTDIPVFLKLISLLLVILSCIVFLYQSVLSGEQEIKAVPEEMNISSDSIPAVDTVQVDTTIFN